MIIWGKDDPKDDCGKFEKNEKELKDLRNTIESMKIFLNTNTINKIENKEKHFWNKHDGKAINDVLKT